MSCEKINYRCPQKDYTALLYEAIVCLGNEINNQELNKTTKGQIDSLCRLLQIAQKFPTNCSSVQHVATLTVANVVKRYEEKNGEDVCMDVKHLHKPTFKYYKGLGTTL